MSEQWEIQKLLNSKLAEARIKNPSYSLRAFARRLGTGSAALSEILNGKRSVSRRFAERLIPKLSLSPKEAYHLLELFPKQGGRGGDMKKLRRTQSLRPIQLSMDEYHLVSDWYHFAILSLLETRDAQTDPVWIGKKLGVPVRDVRSALGRMVRLGMLNKEGDSLKLTGKSFTTTDQSINLSLRKTHAQNLELARRSLEEDPIDRRDFCAMTIATDRSKLPEAARMIREFRDRLCEFLESGEKSDVLKLCVQLFPLTRPQEEEVV